MNHEPAHLINTGWSPHVAIVHSGMHSWAWQNDQNVGHKESSSDQEKVHRKIHQWLPQRNATVGLQSS